MRRTGVVGKAIERLNNSVIDELVVLTRSRCPPTAAACPKDSALSCAALWAKRFAPHAREDSVSSLFIE